MWPPTHTKSTPDALNRNGPEVGTHNFLPFELLKNYSSPCTDFDRPTSVRTPSHRATVGMAKEAFQQKMQSKPLSLAFTKGVAP